MELNKFSSLCLYQGRVIVPPKLERDDITPQAHRWPPKNARRGMAVLATSHSTEERYLWTLNPTVSACPLTTITVCICTFRNPEGLRALLLGLDTQLLETVREQDLTIAVVDNDAGASAAAVLRVIPSAADSSSRVLSSRNADFAARATAPCNWRLPRKPSCLRSWTMMRSRASVGYSH